MTALEQQTVLLGIQSLSISAGIRRHSKLLKVYPTAPMIVFHELQRCVAFANGSHCRVL